MFPLKMDVILFYFKKMPGVVRVQIILMRRYLHTCKRVAFAELPTKDDYCKQRPEYCEYYIKIRLSLSLL